MVANHSVRFGGFRHYDSGDKIVLVCHVIFQE